MIRVLLVEDVELVADAIHLALRREPDFQIVGSSACVAEAMPGMHHADIALVNMHLRNGGALDVVERLSQMAGAPRVVLMGVSCPEEELLPFLDVGIAGYILVESSLSELVETLRMVHRGEAQLSPKLAATVMNRVVVLAQGRDRAAFIDPTFAAVRTLTDRECEVIELVGRGFSNQEIADHLDIEVGTVKNHIHNILRKLDVNSRRAAAALVSRARGSRVLRIPARGASEQTIQPEIAPVPSQPRLRRVPG
jgi:DNA-binding NarL/FixJ family response regulator